VRVHTVHDLAVEFEDEAENAVRGWMLRSEVDVEIADGGFSHGRSPRGSRE
jgi:hypothetical protein